MKAYKGFDKDLKCRDYQYEVGREYEEKKAELCNCGFHACEAPLDTFGYYSPADSRYCAVDLDGVSDEKSDDTKRVGKKIKICAEIGLPGIADAHVEWVNEQVDWEHVKESNTGDRSAATNTGYRSAATNTGYHSAATNPGYRSAATNTGDYSAATNTGNYSAATNTGDQSAATNTGNYSAAEVSGKGSVAIATGIDSRVKGGIGCAIVCVERGKWDGNTYPILSVLSSIVDGKELLPDTWYTVKGGKWVEC